jgi:hypothetical protein
MKTEILKATHELLDMMYCIGTQPLLRMASLPRLQLEQKTN